MKKDDLAVEPRARVLYNAYLKQAEKELAEVKEMTITDEEVAKLVSTIEMKTVSGVADETRGKVLQLIEKLQTENAALRERLEKAVELPFVPTDYHIEAWLSEIKVSLTDESATIVVPVYVYQKFDNAEAAFARLAELKGGKE